MFEVCMNPRMICKEGIIDEIGQIVKQFGNKAFVVAYKNGVRSKGVLDRLKNALVKDGVTFQIYEGIAPDPDISSIDEGARQCAEGGFDVVVGIGGGSVLDAAKAIAMLVTNGGSIRDYQMDGKPITKHPVPLVAIPTTSGTGSEATKVSVVSNTEAGVKKSVAHPLMVPSLALLDPELTISLPAKLTASIGMDALGHAIESYVSLNANPVTEAFGIKAVELIARNLAKAVRDGKNIEARKNMAIASYMAGAALNAGVGIAHMIGQPLGAVCHIAHGDAISILLPAAMRVNLDYSPKKYAELARAMGLDCHGLNDREAGERAIDEVKKLRQQIGAPQTLNEVCSIDKSSYPAVLESISRSTAHIRCNPRPVDEALILDVLDEVL